MVNHWTIERRRIPRLSEVEDVLVTCPRGHLAHKPVRVLRGASVTVPPLPCERCISIDERRAAKAAGAPAPAKPKEAAVPPSERRIAARVAHAGDHLARVAEKAARMEEKQRVRLALERHRAQERVKAAERRAKADRVARQLVKLWEAGELPPEVLKMLEVV